MKYILMKVKSTINNKQHNSNIYKSDVVGDERKNRNRLIIGDINKPLTEQTKQEDKKLINIQKMQIKN